VSATPEDFPATQVYATRWTDNDMYGHLNNAVYYQLFDTMINGWLAASAAVDPTAGEVINVVAESGCRFFAEVGFPSEVTVGLRVARLGNSSVTYELALFDEDAVCAAEGKWVHVYVDAKTRRPAPVPGEIRQALETLVRD
jgi:acyl-CoA thioester hydrolase